MIAGADIDTGKINMAIEIKSTYESITCCTCNLIFLVPDWWKRTRLADCKNFTCPNGHTQSYGEETEEQKLRKRIIGLENQVNNADSAYDEMRRKYNTLLKKTRKKRKKK